MRQPLKIHQALVLLKKDQTNDDPRGSPRDKTSKSEEQDWENTWYMHQVWASKRRSFFRENDTQFIHTPPPQMQKQPPLSHFGTLGLKNPRVFEA